MSVFKQNADLRTAALKELLSSMESERDKLLDEVSEKKGKVYQLEEIIGQVYGMILDINKDEQNKELRHIAEIAEKKKKEEEEEKKKEELDVFSAATKGIKTPKPKRRRKE